MIALHLIAGRIMLTLYTARRPVCGEFTLDQAKHFRGELDQLIRDLEAHGGQHATLQGLIEHIGVASAV